MADYGLLLSPLREASPRVAKSVDFLSLALPVVAAALSIWAGIDALRHLDDSAAFLGIAGGIASAFSVLFTNWASRIRDQRLAIVQATADLASSVAEGVDRRTPSAQF